MDRSHPFTVLRRRIRQAGKQYRHNNDNSRSLFHPNGGFVYAYDIKDVEIALNQYELDMGTELELKEQAMDDIARLKREAVALAEAHPSKDAREFAKDVLKLMEQLKKDQGQGELAAVHRVSDRMVRQAIGS